jgi:hypothetical protein
MQQAPSERTDDPTPKPDEQPRSGLLSHSDPEPEGSSGKPPIWLIAIIVLLVTGVVVLHLTGVLGPASH